MVKGRRVHIAFAAVLLICCAGQALAVTDESKEHTKKGIALYNEGKLDGAIAEFKKAIEIDPKNGDYHRNLSSVYQTANKIPDAIKEGELALKCKSSDNKNVENLSNLGKILLAQNKNADAEKLFRQLVKAQPKGSGNRDLLVICLLNQKKTADAEKECKEALKTSPNDAGTLSSYSRVLLAMGNTDEAEKQARAALKASPKDPDAHFSLARVLQKRGKDKEAVKEYNEVLKIKPDHVSKDDIKKQVDYINNKVDPRIP